MSQSVRFSLGTVLLFWGAANSYVDVMNYGWLAGQYWWFCNLALLGMGYGFLLNDSAFVVGFLAIALYTQTFWLLDDSVFILTGFSPFGLVQHIYSSNYPLEEFALAHYHYFTIPLGLLGLVAMPLKKGQVLKRVLVFNPLIFGVSYFLFSPALNINCIHRACLSALGKIEGPIYSLTFWAVIFIAHILIARRFDSLLFKEPEVFERYKKRIKTIATVLIIIGLLLSIRGLQIKTRLFDSALSKDFGEAK